MSELSVLAFEAAIQKKLAMIQAQRLTPIDTLQPVLKKKAQALLCVIPLIPFLDQLVTHYNQYMPVYNEFIEHICQQQALNPNILYYHFHILQTLHLKLIKEQGMCWAQLDILLSWWVKTPYAKNMASTQVECKLFNHCQQFVNHLPKLVKLNNDIIQHEDRIAQLKLYLLHGIDPHQKHYRTILSEKTHIQRLQEEENMVTDALEQEAQAVINASDIIRTHTPEVAPAIHIQSVYHIDTHWTQHCAIQHP